ncbi:hypothetical protein L484_015206 [Morus notabilis]|uniref:Uncharacterized protein n=1 Tax=Morus notabilis TaxID=981085 RepID=W9SB68_9ROSA|nr:hypothetical protein L484_015206 [Morus notabilis]
MEREGTLVIKSKDTNSSESKEDQNDEEKRNNGNPKGNTKDGDEALCFENGNSRQKGPEKQWKEPLFYKVFKYSSIRFQPMPLLPFLNQTKVSFSAHEDDTMFWPCILVKSAPRLTTLILKVNTHSEGPTDLYIPLTKVVKAPHENLKSLHVEEFSRNLRLRKLIQKLCYNARNLENITLELRQPARVEDFKVYRTMSSIFYSENSNKSCVTESSYLEYQHFMKRNNTVEAASA